MPGLPSTSVWKVLWVMGVNGRAQKTVVYALDEACKGIQISWIKLQCNKTTWQPTQMGYRLISISAHYLEGFNGVKHLLTDGCLTKVFYDSTLLYFHHNTRWLVCRTNYLCDLFHLDVSLRYCSR